jgi:DNA-binding CsgD family transcriptional regulator
LTAGDTVAAHKPFFTGTVSESLLSPRERTVVQLIAEGHGNKRIARILDLGVKTVETHRAAAHRKLGLSYTANLVRYAVRNCIVEA